VLLEEVQKKKKNNTDGNNSEDVVMMNATNDALLGNSGNADNNSHFVKNGGSKM